MSKAHRAYPLVAKNRVAASAVLRPLHRPSGPALRVALVAHDFAPKLGGMETVARSLAGSLSSRGVSVRVYTTNRLGARSSSDRVVEPLYRALPPPLRIDLASDLLTTIE